MPTTGYNFSYKTPYGPGPMSEPLLQTDLTLGCDPEVFITDGAKLIPAFDFLPSKQGGSPVFWDGLQAEFIVQPSSDVDRIVAGIREGLANLAERARLFNKKSKILLQDCYWMEAELLARLTDEQAALGCDPSANIYGEKAFLPSDPRELPFRFAGGHIHFGSDNLRKFAVGEQRIFGWAKFVMLLDSTLGIWSVALNSAAEATKQRRNYYGQAGEVRTPPHGIEWRTLSNFWLASPKLARWTLLFAKAVYLEYLNGGCDRFILMFHGALINNYDRKSAIELLSQQYVQFVRMLSKVMGMDEANEVYNWALKPSRTPVPADVEKAWGI